MPDPNTQQGRKSIDELVRGAPTPITLPTTRPNATTSTASLSMDSANIIHTGGPYSTSIRDVDNAGHLAGRSSMHKAVTSVREASHNSTPGRPTLGSTPKQATVKDVEDQMDYDLERHRNSGIDASTFLCKALMLDKGEYEKLKGKIDATTVNVTGTDAYKEQLEVFQNVTAIKRIGMPTSKEADMYKPFVEMSNMLLEELEKADPDEAKQVRLCYSGDHQVRLGRDNRPAMKPDILLVPKSVADKGREELGGFHIRQVLSPFELKLKKNPMNGIKFSYNAKDTSIATFASRAADADVFQSTPMISKNKSCVSTGTAGSGRKRKAGKQATDGSNKAARGEEGRTASSASRALDTDSAKDSDPHGRRQISRYAAAALSDRGDRKFVYGVRLNAREMTFAIYHRSGIVEADAFDFCEHPEYFALFLYMFQRDPSTYGFNTMTGYHDPFDIYNKESATMTMDIKDKLVEKNEKYEESGVYDDLQVDKEEAAEYCIVGRGGSVYKAVAPNHNPKDVPAMAVKFSWQSTSRKHEFENMEIARKSISENVAKTYGYATIEDDSPFEALRNACSHPQKNYTKKTFRVLVMKHYRRLSDVDNMKIFWELIRQLVICLHKLYAEQKLLHRDISIGNLAYEMVNGEPVIIILDFELATVVGDEVRTNEVRTGTAPFMAREVLAGFESGYTHTLNHDLESVYYIVGWHLAGYRGYLLPSFEGNEQDPLQEWWKKDYQEMCQAKEKHMALRASDDPFSNLSVPTDGLLAGRLARVRRQYGRRWMLVKERDTAEVKLEAEAFRRFESEAVNLGLEEEEELGYVKKKMDAFKAEIKSRRPTTAISFKEWVIAARFTLPKDMDINDCTRRDCCGDELANKVIQES